MIVDKKRVAVEWDGAWFCEHCWGSQHWRKKLISQKMVKKFVINVLTNINKCDIIYM